MEVSRLCSRGQELWPRCPIQPFEADVDHGRDGVGNQDLAGPCVRSSCPFFTTGKGRGHNGEPPVGRIRSTNRDLGPTGWDGSTKIGKSAGRGFTAAAKESDCATESIYENVFSVG